MKEITIYKGLSVAEKSKNYQNPEKVKKYFGTLDSDLSPEVKEAISEGFDNFKTAVVKRILKEHSTEIIINKCPKCNNILRTPKAKLCTWCHHSWHNEV